MPIPQLRPAVLVRQELEVAGVGHAQHFCARGASNVSIREARNTSIIQYRTEAGEEAEAEAEATAETEAEAEARAEADEKRRGRERGNEESREVRVGGPMHFIIHRSSAPSLSYVWQSALGKCRQGMHLEWSPSRTPASTGQP